MIRSWVRIVRLPPSLASWSSSPGSAGFRLGMEPHGFETVWANQWEPGTAAQHAWDAYVARFYDGDRDAAPKRGNEDIERVMDHAEKGRVRDSRTTTSSSAASPASRPGPPS